MKYLYFVILMSLIACSSRSESGIVIKQEIKENTIVKYNTAVIYVENENDKSSNDVMVETTKIMVESLLTAGIGKIGIKEVYNEKNASLKVECHFLIGWGLPRFGRHFKLSAKYIIFVNIKLVDLSSNKVVGEVEYKKPFFQSDQKNIIDELLNELIRGTTSSEQ